MGHFAYLNGSDSDGPHIRNADAPASDVVLRSMKGHVPPLWLALFGPEGLRWGTRYLTPGDICWEPYLVARREDCVARYQRRRAWLRRVFRHHRHAVESWESIIRAMESPYLKLELDDVSNVIDGFSDALVMESCGLFDQAPDVELAALARLTGEWSYDGANGAFVWHVANAHWVADDGDLMGGAELRPGFLNSPLGVLILVAVAALAGVFYIYS